MAIRSVRADVPKGFCECGCGARTWVATVTNHRYGWTQGEPVRFVAGHNSKLYSALNGTHGYPGVSIGHRETMAIHRLRAERALGKPLPKGAVVHHADGSKAVDAPLVICQDHAYHMLLHHRLRVKQAGGDPNVDHLCSGCRQAKPFAAFNRFKYGANGLSPYCRDCWNAKKRAAA